MFELTLIDNCEARISYAYEIDYHNFIVLSTNIGKAFLNHGQEESIQRDCQVFNELLNENVIHPAIRKFYQRAMDEKMQGELNEFFVSCEQNNVTLHDLLKAALQSLKLFENKVFFYGGKDALMVFNEYLDKSAKEQTITVENDITVDKWALYFYYENSRDRFFHCEANEYLFHSILTPVIKGFYNDFRD